MIVSPRFIRYHSIQFRHDLIDSHDILNLILEIVHEFLDANSIVNIFLFHLSLVLRNLSWAAGGRVGRHGNGMFSESSWNVLSQMI